jgi:hypothetical protein
VLYERAGRLHLVSKIIYRAETMSESFFVVFTIIIFVYSRLVDLFPLVRNDLRMLDDAPIAI